MADDCCEEPRICEVSAKCSDMFTATIDGDQYDGYVPPDLGIGEGDYVKFNFCLNCGKIQGDWPMPESEIEKGITDDPDFETCGECDGSGQCAPCDGTGEEDGETCESCDGSGTCSECGGDGEVPA